MKIEVLGCSGGIGQGLHTTSFLIDEDILLDAGTGVATLAPAQLASIRHIFVTHSHLDHVASIPLLLDSVFDLIEQPIILYGLEKTLKAVQDHIFNWVIWPDFAKLPHPDRAVLSYEIMQPGDAVTLSGRTFELIDVNHAVPGAAYRISTPSGAMAFSGDTTTNDSLWQALNAHENLDLLFVESAFADEMIELARLAHHYCPSLLAADLRKLQHRPELYISHHKPGSEAEIMRQCEAQLPEREPRRLSPGMVFHL